MQSDDIDAQAFLSAARTGDISTLRRGIGAGLAKSAKTPNMKEQNRFLSSVYPEDDRTALMLAVAFGHVDCARELMQASDPLAMDAYGATALALAASAGAAELVELLASGEGARAIDQSGATPLMKAASSGCARSVGILLPLSDSSQVDEMGWDALMYAAMSAESPRGFAMIELMASHGDVTKKSKHGLCAAQLARNCGQKMSARLLEEKMAQKERGEISADSGVELGGRELRRKSL